MPGQPRGTFSAGLCEFSIFWADIQSDPIPTDVVPIVQCWAEGPVFNDLLRIECWAHELTEPTGWNVESTIDLDGNVETVALVPTGGGLHGYGWTHIVTLNGTVDVFWQAAITDAGAIHHSPCAMTRSGAHLLTTPSESTK